MGACSPAVSAGRVVGPECDPVTEILWVILTQRYFLGEFEGKMSRSKNVKTMNNYSGLHPSIGDDHPPLVVFDGVCVLCSHYVKWVIGRDRNSLFLFTHAQSELGQALYERLDLDRVNFETNLVIHRGKVFMRMQAFTEICRLLGWPWRVMTLLNFLPDVLNNWVYERIKRNRYRLFGKREVCLVSDAELARRFID